MRYRAAANAAANRAAAAALNPVADGDPTRMGAAAGGMSMEGGPWPADMRTGAWRVGDTELVSAGRQFPGLSICGQARGVLEIRNSSQPADKFLACRCADRRSCGSA